MADALLEFLLAAERSARKAHEDAAAALDAYRGAAPAEPVEAERLVPLKEAVSLFTVKEVTLRRDVLVKKMGRKEPGRNGKVYVDVVEVGRYRVPRKG